MNLMLAKLGITNTRHCFCFCVIQSKRWLGGLDSFMGLGWLHISTLTIAEELRGYGYGRALLLAAEQEAVRHSCFNAYVFTYSFQAPEFYQHLGYEVFAELEDFPPGHRRYFLKKRLTKKSPS